MGVEIRMIKTAEPDSALRYVANVYSEHLTDTDILKLAEGRGLAVGVLGSRALQAAQS